MRRDIGRRRKTKGRRLSDGRRVAGLTSAIVPVAVGVVLAFAWNTAGSYKPTSPAPDPGFPPEVEVAVEQATAQAWVRITPEAHMTSAAMTGNSPASADRDTSLSTGPGGPRGTGCRRPSSSRPAWGAGVPPASSMGASLEGLLTPQSGRRVLSVPAIAADCSAPRKPRRPSAGKTPVPSSISARPTGLPASRDAAWQFRDLRAQAQRSRA